MLSTYRPGTKLVCSPMACESVGLTCQHLLRIRPPNHINWAHSQTSLVSAFHRSPLRGERCPPPHILLMSDTRGELSGSRAPRAAGNVPRHVPRPAFTSAAVRGARDELQLLQRHLGRAERFSRGEPSSHARSGGTVVLHCSEVQRNLGGGLKESTIGLQPYPQKVVRPAKGSNLLRFRGWGGCQGGRIPPV